MTDQQTNSETPSAILILAWILLCIFGFAIFFGFIMPEFEKSYPQSTLIPCEKVAIVTEKYSRISEYGINYWIIANGQEIRVNDKMLDGGKNTFRQIPLNTTVILYGGYFNEVNKFAEVKNVIKIIGTDCVNCCRVEYVK